MVFGQCANKFPFLHTLYKNEVPLYDKDRADNKGKRFPEFVLPLLTSLLLQLSFPFSRVSFENRFLPFSKKNQKMYGWRLLKYLELFNY